ncbi:MAG: hypothetical protein CMM83_03745 [Rhodospirillales bacterium]|nr:hypothetical protein [Rhodospirillales bacterium]|tara:strand:- start:3803 stop:4414 length:612 start_codon:yes stop_codon:yes gene_type:complete
MTPLALIRHGPTLWNEQRKLQGQTDIPLSTLGIQRVNTWVLPDKFKNYQWFASPLKRAQKTASLLGLKTKTEPSLIEMDWGQWDGLTGQQLQEKYGAEFVKRKKKGIDLRPDGGETPREVRNRVHKWIKIIAKNKRPTGAVSHQGIIRAAISLATGWNMINPAPEELEWDAVQLFRVDLNGNVKIDQLNISLISNKKIYPEPR